MTPSFKVLRLNELVMLWLRIYSHRLAPDTILADDFFKSITTYYIWFNMFAFIGTSAAFVCQNTSNIMDALRTAMVVVGSSQALGMFSSFGCKITKVKLLHQKLQAIVDQAAKGKSERLVFENLIDCFLCFWNFADGHRHIVDLYWAIEQKCCFYTKLMLYYIYSHQMPVVAALAYGIYCICIGDFNTSAWNLPFNVAVPFDTQSIRGWLLKWFFEFSAGFAYILCMIIPTTYFFCFCLYLMGICSHFDVLVNEIKFDVDELQCHTNQQENSPTIWYCVRKKLFQLIDIHVNALE